MGTLICAALAFGYGPCAKLITVAQALPADVRLVFVGRGAALELARRTRGLFASFLECSPEAAAEGFATADVRGVLTLMDPGAGPLARALGVPLFVIDSLLWMRPEIPAALRDARTYWAQRFPGLDAGAYAPRPVAVGPIVAPPVTPPAASRHGLVVNLGGSAAPDGRQGLYEDYARFVLDAVWAAGPHERFGQVTILGGSAILGARAGSVHDARAGGIHGVRAGDVDDARVTIESVALDDARARMCRAQAVLTAPGLTTTLECFQAGTPTWFLPPQNYSQWCLLRHLRAAHAADDAFHWEDLEDGPALAERLPPAERDPRVVAALRRCTHDAGAAALLRRRLDAVGENPAARVAAQSAFFTALGPDGTGPIAQVLRELTA